MLNRKRNILATKIHDGDDSRLCRGIRQCGGVGHLRRTSGDIPCRKQDHRCSAKEVCATFVCGTKTYRILRYLLAPTKPTASTYVDIVSRLSEHFNPKQGEAVKRHQFNSRSGQPGESIYKFVAELRHLATGCEFGKLAQRDAV